MNLDLIKQTVLRQDLNDGQKETIILHIIGKDKQSIPYILGMLSREREQQKELVNDMNSVITFSETYIIMNKQNRKKLILNRREVYEKIKSFYEKWTGVISSFNNMDKLREETEREK